MTILVPNSLKVQSDNALGPNNSKTYKPFLKDKTVDSISKSLHPTTQANIQNQNNSHLLSNANQTKHTQIQNRNYTRAQQNEHFSRTEQITNAEKQPSSFTRTQQNNQNPNPSSNYTRKTKPMFRWCLDDVWIMFQGCLDDIQMMFCWFVVGLFVLLARFADRPLSVFQLNRNKKHIYRGFRTSLTISLKIRKPSTSH